MNNRDSFQSRWGFILACIGSAVGMGNIWMFPTRVSLYGGGSFLIPYILFVILIGFTTLLQLVMTDIARKLYRIRLPSIFYFIFLTFIYSVL